MPKRLDYLVCYDSPDDRRRDCLLTSVRGFGIDPQYSFHECALSLGERTELWKRLAAGTGSEDRLLFMGLSPGAERWRLGRPPIRGEAVKGLIYVG